MIRKWIPPYEGPVHRKESQTYVSSRDGQVIMPCPMHGTLVRSVASETKVTPKHIWGLHILRHRPTWSSHLIQKDF